MGTNLFLYRINIIAMGKHMGLHRKLDTRWREEGIHMGVYRNPDTRWDICMGRNCKYGKNVDNLLFDVLRHNDYIQVQEHFL